MRKRLLLLLLLPACNTRDNLHALDWDLNRMDHQPRYDPYGSGPGLPGGMVMQLPPAGTVSRENPVEPPAVDRGVNDDGSYVARSPVPVTAALLAEGKARFDVICAACHGLLGEGRSAVAAHMSFIRPRNLVGPEVLRYPPGRIVAVIRDGFGLMPSYRSRLDARERWAVTAYVGALQLARRGTPLEELPADIRARAVGELPP